MAENENNSEKMRRRPVVPATYFGFLSIKKSEAADWDVHNICMIYERELADSEFELIHGVTKVTLGIHFV